VPHALDARRMRGADDIIIQNRLDLAGGFLGLLTPAML